jgi:hypothetical protein
LSHHTIGIATQNLPIDWIGEIKRELHGLSVSWKAW